MKSKKVVGVKLKLQIAESNLEAKNTELDRIKRLFSEVTTERDFLRKVMLQITQSQVR